MLDLGKVERLASAALEYVQHIQASGLEVRGRVVRLRDEDLRLGSVIDRLQVVRDGNELLCDRLEQVQTRLDLNLRILGLHGGRDHAHEPALGGHLVGGAHQRHVNVRLAAHLLLWNDYLRGQTVLGAGHRMVQNANATNHLATLAHLSDRKVVLEDLNYFLVTNLIGHITGVAVDLLALGDLVAGAHANYLAALAQHDLVDGLVQHVGTTVDGRQPSESLGQLAQAIHGVEVGRLAVPCQRVRVELDAPDSVHGWLVQILVITEQGQGVAREVLRVLVQSELVVQPLHIGLGGVEVLPGLGIILPEVLHVDEEVTEASLLEHACEWDVCA